jgi:cyclophilin family peptidyl-prolyl cis-trans isomerase
MVCLADNFLVKHDKPGIVTMVTTSAGGLLVGSKFQIFRYASPWHDGHHAAFGEELCSKRGTYQENSRSPSLIGEVVNGMDVVEEIGRLHPGDGPPSRSVVITACGIIAVNLLLKGMHRTFTLMEIVALTRPLHIKIHNLKMLEI